MAWTLSDDALIASPRFPPIETDPFVDTLIAAHAPVAIGVSGGKDSTVAAFETSAHLERAGHKGPKLLIHSDLGRVEHTDSRPACERLAAHLGLELVVVKRKAGDLMDRWQVRWQHNLERYRQLQCVKLILPWSTPAMRFCTSELKTAVICRALVERFPHNTILSVVGLRRQESPSRAQAPVCAPQVKLRSETFGTTGYSWNPILAWSREDVLAYHGFCGFPLHEAYTTYGLSRVSCAFCILAGIDDLMASATDPRNHDIYREMVELEIISTFSFQSGRWLGDVAPHLLSGDTLARLKEAKQQAASRERVEVRIPKHLHYVKGWPTVMPTRAEAVLLSEVRRSVADIMHLTIAYSEPEEILNRYAELIALRVARRKGMSSPSTPTSPIQQELWSCVL
ncbi:MAG TPA: phosphoadenosine phosphosulfate reductase family protein [Ktedonobacteraceae bacterium]|nr:phosphoadenosine phosphosulfate reductase family protein [Ktedonobacteraceae bacterium]